MSGNPAAPFPEACLSAPVPGAEQAARAFAVPFAPLPKACLVAPMPGMGRALQSAPLPRSQARARRCAT
eukprot:754383-Pyramimonas_sp.AAC.1